MAWRPVGCQHGFSTRLCLARYRAEGLLRFSAG
jgi:hypothetical protein